MMRAHLILIGAAAALLASCKSQEVVVDPPEITAALSWMDEAAKPLATFDPAASRTDLAPFAAMAGSAKIIGFGEATYGSHEFFSLTQRFLRQLVEEGGVTGFAIHASMPEAFGIDTYVRTGVGNPATLLSHLYLWTWNQQEVADLVAWLRQWNQQHPTKQVGFYGFDMQYPGVAIDSVLSYVARTRPSLSASFSDHYGCMANYRNDTHGVFTHQYAEGPSQFWESCAIGMKAATDLLIENKTALVSASSERDYQLALQMSRLVSQWEQAPRAPSPTAASRDQSMASNVAWLLDREGTGGRLVLFGHDFYVGRFGTMGSYLKQSFGANYLPVGVAFGSGGLNAAEGFAGGVFGSVKAFSAPVPKKADSYEATLSRVDAPNFYLDLRTASGVAKTWLDGPHPMRTVGTAYFSTDPELHFSGTPLTTLFDVLIFVRTTTASTLLPFQY